MKKLILHLATCFAVSCLFAQTTGRLENLKDGWGTSYNYIGEIKNKQPNGVGVAIYSGSTALRYAGNFVNGQYSGKGVLLFSDATFLSGDWKNGKLNGKGAYLNKDGDIYIGEFVNGAKDGKCSFVFGDKSILCGSMKNDTYHGRCIFISASGMTLTDNIYENGKKNGSGYQYEADSKKLYEGTWSDGQWVSSSTASYSSFLKSNKFYSEKTDNQILIGCIDKTNKDVLDDTAFFYDLAANKRNFGYYAKGYLADGIIVRDSSRFFGKVNDKGAYGNCSVYKVKKFYDEGTYESDYLTGANCLSIDLDKKSIYYGTASNNGSFTGKAWYINNFNEVFNGSFIKGKFTGSGYIVYNTAKTVKGVFQAGRVTTLTSITDENGAPIHLKPKGFGAALNLVTGEFKNDLVVFKTLEDTVNYVDEYYSADKSVLSFPGSISTNIIFEDYDFYLGYRADFYKGKNFQAAKTQYEKLCGDIAASSIKLVDASTVKPSGMMKPAREAMTTSTQFTIATSYLSDYSIYAELKYDNGNYRVSLIAGELELKEDSDQPPRPN